MRDPKVEIVYCPICGEYYEVGEHHRCAMPPSEMDEEETIEDEDSDF